MTTNWQPIETAPKGGGAERVDDPRYQEPPRLLLATGDGEVYIAYWDAYYAAGGKGCTDGVAWVMDGGDLLHHDHGLPVAWANLPRYIAHPAPILPTLDHETNVEPHQNRRESGASILQPLAAVAAILTTLALAKALQRPAPAGRSYHPIPLALIAQAAAGDPIVPTHVVTYGTVRLVRQEADGDLHVRLCDMADPATCIVLECIPELPCKAPRYGDHVTAQGISRWDTAHRWQELHPVLNLEVDK